DFEMAKEVYRFENSAQNHLSSITKKGKSIFDLPIFSVKRKKNLGKKITKDGVLAIISAILMVIVCVLILSILS
ncbi:MAG: hypothetical protein AAGI07_09045, partial [Bacteroidota bacterium]